MAPARVGGRPALGRGAGGVRRAGARAGRPAPAPAGVRDVPSSAHGAAARARGLTYETDRTGAPVGAVPSTSRRATAMGSSNAACALESSDRVGPGDRPGYGPGRARGRYAALRCSCLGHRPVTEVLDELVAAGLPGARGAAAAAHTRPLGLRSARAAGT